MKISDYDFFFIFFNNVLGEDEIWLVGELRKLGKSFALVRTKIDIDIVVSPDPAIAKPSSPGFKFLMVLMNVDFPVALRPVIANFTCSFFHLFKLLSKNDQIAFYDLPVIRLPQLRKKII
jgi:hypothetical protein